jgi:4-hydroxy-tetrahydrodipicolinate reductase
VTAPAEPIRLVIVGASGRMGQSLLRLLPQFPQLRLHAAVAGEHSGSLGRDAGEAAGLTRLRVPISADLEGALKGAALALDFSTAATAARQLALCAAAGVPLLLGTTGLGPELSLPLGQAAQRIPLLVAANTSLGAAVLEQLVRHAATALGDGFDVRIQDTHHRHKKDAPSGTALALGKAATEPRGALAPVHYSSVREGEVVGEHEVKFVGEGERLELRHVAQDRAVFARGALRAGLWLLRQKAGLYQMADIFKEK